MKREKTLDVYVINRASRIYSVAIPALILGFSVAILNAVISGTDLPYQLEKLWLYIPIYLSFIGNSWSLSELPPANFPYWSLNYEVWYYIFFATCFYLRGLGRYVAVTIAVMFMGPDLWLMLPTWLLGSALYYYRNHIDRLFSVGSARLVLVLSILAFVLVRLFHIDNVFDSYNATVLANVLPQLYIPKQWLGDYLLAVIVFINFASARSAELTFSDKTTKVIKKVASYSFSCYLFHIPVYHFIKYSIAPPTDSMAIWLMSIMSALAVIA